MTITSLVIVCMCNIESVVAGGILCAYAYCPKDMLAGTPLKYYILRLQTIPMTFHTRGYNRQPSESVILFLMLRLVRNEFINAVLKCKIIMSIVLQDKNRLFEALHLFQFTTVFHNWKLN